MKKRMYYYQSLPSGMRWCWTTRWRKFSFAGLTQVDSCLPDDGRKIVLKCLRNWEGIRAGGRSHRPHGPSVGRLVSLSGQRQDLYVEDS
jgi:hypothetical protein